MEDSESVFIDDMVIHISAYNYYKSIYRLHGYTKLRKILKKRWYSKSDQNKVISKIHQDGKHSHENRSIGS